MELLIDLRSALTPYRAGGVVQYINSITRGQLNHHCITNPIILAWTGLQTPHLAPDLLVHYNARVVARRIPNKIINNTLFALNRPLLDKLFSLKKDGVYFVPHFLNAPVDQNIKKVITIHDLSFLHYPQFLTPRDRFWHLRNKIKQNLHSARHIIAISESTKEDIVNFYNIASEKISVIYHGIDHSQYYPITDATLLANERKRLELPENYILYLGPIEPRKNIGALVSAFKTLKQNKRFDSLKLVIAGFTLTPFTPEHPDIVFFPNIAEQDKLYFYNGARAFVYPSFFEGFGFPPLEAGACKIPVIASHTSSLAEILNDSAILVNPFRISDIITALTELLTDNALAEYFKEKIYAKAQQFTWEKSTQQTLAVFKEI